MSRENGGMPEIKVGQVWRRKSDGVETVVTAVPHPQYVNGWVSHKARRTTDTTRLNFLKNYKLVKEADDGE